MRARTENVIYPVPMLIRNLPWTRVIRGLFKPTECEQLVRLGAQKAGKSKRRSQVQRGEREAWSFDLYPDDAQWAYERVARTFAQENVWGFALTGIVEPLTVLMYPRGARAELHSDHDYSDQNQSKITAIIPLVDRRAWTGGELSVGSGGAVRALNRGDCVLFPSFAGHWVSSVRKGMRTVLAAWVAGPQPV